jgi:predicted nucleotidyltransferase
MMTLLTQIELDRQRDSEQLRQAMLRQLHAELQKLIPGAAVILFGSLIQPGKFNEFSDVDLALETEPKGFSIYQLTSLLAEGLGRKVDVVLLPECRFADKIRKQGQQWTGRD